MINVEPAFRRRVESILEHHVPGREVRAFGSRVLGTAKPYSDLDLVVMGHERLPTPVLYHLRDVFEESDLPFRIDILDWNRLTVGFRNAIYSRSEVLCASPKGDL